jgi:hypothetical protein
MMFAAFLIHSEKTKAEGPESVVRFACDIQWTAPAYLLNGEATV